MKGHMTMAKAVTIIPATKNIFTALPTVLLSKRRVGAYARVSTDSDEQFTSYEAQVDYYTRYIQSREDWEFVKVYTDEGITGTNTKRRDGFNQMVQDALDGKIDLIVTKSVSRFARNTVDSLVTVRKLKEHGVEVYFEKENIFTFDGKGELLITIMSSLAQEESRSISENVTWGHRKRFADGKVTIAYKHFLGYEKGEDGKPKVNEEEAKVVRLIYKLFLEGKTSTGICRYLEHLGIRSPGGRSKWSESTVTSILQNEKYKGDALLQKTFTVDFLTKKTKVNEGEVPQYYVENNHEAIITPITLTGLYGANPSMVIIRFTEENTTIYTFITLTGLSCIKSVLRDSLTIVESTIAKVTLTGLHATRMSVSFDFNSFCNFNVRIIIKY